jgi:hypothetical protein
VLTDLSIRAGSAVAGASCGLLVDALPAAFVARAQPTGGAGAGGTGLGSPSAAPPQQPSRPQPPRRAGVGRRTKPVRGHRRVDERSILVATLNVHLLQRQEKLDYVIKGCKKTGIVVLLCQETWQGPDSALSLPEGWIQHSAPHPSMGTRGRGLSIIINEAAIGRRGWKISFVSQSSSATHDFLAVRVGPWLMASVYVPCTQTTGPAYHQLALDIAALRRSPDDQVIVGGDFNGGGAHALLTESMAGVLQCTPLLAPPYTTRLDPRAGRDGASLLDNIYYPYDAAVVMVGLEQFEGYTALSEPLEWDGKVHNLSDHHIVVARVPTPGTVCPPEEPSPPPARPKRRLRWKKLSSLARDAQSGPPAAKAAASATLAKMEDTIKAMETSDLAEANETFLQICRRELGTYQPRSGVRHPYLSHPAVKTALRKQHTARKRFHRVRERACHPDKIRAAQAASNAAHRAFQVARDEAILQTSHDLMTRIEDGGTEHFFRRYQRARGAKKRVDRATPHLDATETAKFWQSIYTNQTPDVSQLAPITDEVVEITSEMVATAIQQMSRKCEGPDGMDFRFFRQFWETLSVVLARCFTEALARGIPEGLRMAVTLLFPKASIHSIKPEEYRPITLLCMVIRILHKVLDNLFRSGMGSQRTGNPPAGAGEAERQEPLFTFQRTQAGFLPQRNTYEQATLLQLIQGIYKEAIGGKKMLCGIFLDIKKAYDSMEYSHLLDILKTRHRFPKSWLELLRKFLPGNKTMIMGQEVQLLRGLPQGGALCPFLCDAFMDDLACELAEYIQRHPHLGKLWRVREDPVTWHSWALPDRVQSLWLRLLQFADDIGILASSPEEAQELLDVVAMWAKKRHLEFSPKSYAVLLKKPALAEDLVEPFPDLHLGDVTITWKPHNEPIRYLGVTVQGATSGWWLRGKTKAALKEDKVQGCLWGLYHMFRIAPRKHFVIPKVLRLGIEQVVYASSLYGTALVDTDYVKLDHMVTSKATQIFQAPPTTPSCFVRWELRLWHTELRAEKRAMQLAAYLWHHSWIGQDILKPIHDAHIGYHNEHPLFNTGVLARIKDILERYKLSWAKVQTALAYSYDEKGKTALAKVMQDLILPQFAQRSIAKARATTGMSANHRRELLEHMAVPETSDDNMGLEGPDYVRFDLPIYLYVGGDLPRAGFWMRMPYLRLKYRDSEPRHACNWCHKEDSEYGHHLMRCRRMPPGLLRRRNEVLKDILADAKDASRGEIKDSLENMSRLFFLYWRGKGNWVKGPKASSSRRTDADNQPSKEVLIKALWYMRAVISTYRKSTAGTGPGGINPLWELPVYGQDPYAGDDDSGGPEDAGDDHDGDHSHGAPSTCDSLWRMQSQAEWYESEEEPIQGSDVAEVLRIGSQRPAQIHSSLSWLENLQEEDEE